MTKKSTPPKATPSTKTTIGKVIIRPDMPQIGSNSMPKFETPPPPPPKKID